MTRVPLRNDYDELRADIFKFVKENFSDKDFTIHDLDPIAKKYDATFRQMSSAIGVLSMKKVFKRVGRVRTEKKWPQTNQVSLMRLISNEMPASKKSGKNYPKLVAEKEHRAASAASRLTTWMNGLLTKDKNGRSANN